MKFVDFKKSLNEKIEPIYVFYGEDRYLIDTCLKNLKSACEIELPEMNISLFDEYCNIDDIFTSCETLPFMDKLRLVIVKDIELTDNLKNKLIQYAQNPNKSATLAISIKGTTKEMENIIIVNCEKLDFDLIKKKVVTDLSKQGFLISNDAIKLLTNYCDFNLTQIYSELDKLKSFANENKTISEEMVKTLSVKDISFNIFELTDALGSKQGDKAINILNYLLKTEDPMLILGLLYGYFRRLLIVSMMPANADNFSLSEDLQVKPYAITLAKKQSQYFTPKKLLSLCEKLQKIDISLKSTFSNAETEIYSFAFLALN